MLKPSSFLRARPSETVPEIEAPTRLPAPARPRLQVVTDLATLESLRRPWAALVAACAERSRAAGIFLSPQWLLPYLHHFPTGALRACLVWRDGADGVSRLCGLAILEIVSDGTDAADGRAGDPRRGRRVLRLVGTPVSDYQGALVAPGHDGDGVADQLRAAVVGLAREWDEADLDQIPVADPLLPRLQAGLPLDFAVELLQGEVCPYVPLEPPTPPDAPPPPSDSFAGRLGRALRALGRQGPTSLERARAEHLEEFLEALFRLHGARWQGRGGPGLLSRAREQAFHREVAREMDRAGMLRLSGLRFCGRLEAVFYGFALGPTLSAYLGGFNPELAHFSPGLLTIWQAQADAAREGRQELDFLRGGEAYKFRFGARPRHNRRLLVRRR